MDDSSTFIGRFNDNDNQRSISGNYGDTDVFLNSQT
jgi:hypothetical protein